MFLSFADLASYIYVRHFNLSRRLQGELLSSENRQNILISSIIANSHAPFIVCKVSLSLFALTIPRYYLP